MASPRSGPEVDRAAVALGPGQLAIVETLVEPPGPGEVLVRMEASGVCRSDLHVLDTGWAHRFPVLLGHEAAGVVEQLGAGTEGLAPGDRVILGWRTPCRQCRACLAGDLRRCLRPATAGRRIRLADGRELSPMLGVGSFATRTVVRAESAVPYRGLPPDQACLIGCCIATGIGSVLATAHPAAGSRVAVIGCGAVGLAAVQGARLAGCSEIHAIDLRQDKAEAARRFGATHTGPDEDLDAVFDVVGNGATFEQAIGMLGRAGTVVLVGLPTPGAVARVALEPLFNKRLRVLVSHGGDHLPAEDFPRYVDHALAGEVDLNGLVTKTIALDDVGAAFEDMEAGRVTRSVIVRF